MEITVEVLEHGRKTLEENLGYSISRLCFLSDFLFEFTTYDEKKSELFATKALEVIEAISTSTTFKYIESSEKNHNWFLVMCNMPFFSERISWGTSIRGAFWDYREQVLSSYGLWNTNQQLTGFGFNRDEWIRFCAVLIEYGRDSTAPLAIPHQRA